MNYKGGILAVLNVNYWFYFSRVRYTLLLKLVDDGMVYYFAYKKVAKLSKEECIELLTKLNSTSFAYKKGYSDGDYWNNSQNPYHFKNDYKNWLDYESGFSKCKEDKKKYWQEHIMSELEKRAKEPKVEDYESEPIDIEKYKKLLEQHKWDISNPNEIEERNNLLRLASTNNEFQKAYFKAKEKWQPFSGR